MMLASLRIGEALALKWENIDFEKGALFVEQGLTEDVDMQIENKRNIKDVQHLLGHKDAKTTQLHYNSVIDQELDYEGAKRRTY